MSRTTRFLKRRADTTDNVACQDGLGKVDDVLILTGNDRSCEPKVCGEKSVPAFIFSYK